MRRNDDLPDVTLEFLYQRCTECDGCMLWNRRISHGPIININRREWKVRHLVWRLTRVRAPQKNQIPMPTVCGNEDCIHKDHLRLVVRNGHVRGKKLTLTHRANIAAAQRARTTKADMSVATAIRESSETLEALAGRHGLCLAMVQRIKTNKAWVDYRNPFAQLLGAQ